MLAVMLSGGDTAGEVEADGDDPLAISKGEQAKLRLAFSLYDKNGDGKISLAEFCSIMAKDTGEGLATRTQPRSQQQTAQPARPTQ